MATVLSVLIKAVNYGDLMPYAPLLTQLAGYTMKPTGSDSPHQNGKVERLNC